LAASERVYVLGKLPGKQWVLVSQNDEPLGYVVATWLVAESEYGRQAPVPVATTEPATPAQAPAEPELQQAFAGIEFGSYHALVIGNDAYRMLPRLATAVRDATAVAELLQRDYGFEVEILVDATRDEIIGKLSALRKRLTEDDNLLVYYAGHGVYDEAADRGYWLPVDAALEVPSAWVSNADITDVIKAMQARHVLVVADSCYSGTLTRGLSIAQSDPGYIKRMVEKRARVALTSGGLEPVMDAGGGGHSVFARAFIDVLTENTGVLDGQQLFALVREPVTVNAEQTPEYGNIRFAGHDGGDFLFVRRQ
jgi:uncharacterized caspase-like protein